MEPAYVASATSRGGRTGHVSTASGFIDQDVQVPTEFGGPGGATNPEELFAAGYASCFMSTIVLLATKREIDTSQASATANVGVVLDKGFDLTVEMVVRLPSVERAMAEKLVSRAHDLCPYSRATRGNVPVELTIAEPVAA